MAQISISEAAKLVGRSRTTLHRAIVAGRISATRSATGAQQVETSELVRVYGDLALPTQQHATVALQHLATPNATVTVAQYDELKAENKRLEALMVAKDANLDDLRNTVRLLEYSKPRAWWKIW